MAKNIKGDLTGHTKGNLMKKRYDNMTRLLIIFFKIKSEFVTRLQPPHTRLTIRLFA